MTSPNLNDLRNWYVGLPDTDKIVFLALVSSQLTIHCRAFGLDLSGEQQIMAFKGLNEIQHQISFQLAGLGPKCERYPDDVFLNILSEKASSFGLWDHLAQAIDQARRQTDSDR